MIDGGSRAKWELYHLPSDPSQTVNRVKEDISTAAHLHEEYIAFLERIGTACDKIKLRTVE